MKTSELQGAALDWAVAKCEGATETAPQKFYGWKGALFGYSTNWSQGGPIIEREKLVIAPSNHWGSPRAWYANTTGRNKFHVLYGLTPLIAAMRCYVTSKLGDEVEIPKELK